MALSQAANLVEKAVGHTDTADIHTDISNYSKPGHGDPSEKILVTTWEGKKSIKVVHAPKPKIVDDGDVILKVTGSTICGSDLHLYHGVIPQLQKGDVLGHEFCGIVDSVGPGVGTVKVGDRVVASFPISCGDCRFCKEKLTTACERTNANKIANVMYGNRPAGIFGYSHFAGGFAGGQSEYVRVPHGEQNLLHLPDDVPDEKGLYLSDVLATSYHCVVDTGVQKGDTVAVWGAGPIGQMVATFSFQQGAGRVILIDGGDAAWRLGFVKGKLPRLETLNFGTLPDGESVTSQLKKMTGAGPDVCLDCTAGEFAKGWTHSLEIMLGLETDTSETLNEMVTSVRSFGRIGLTGVYAGYTNHFNIGAVMQTGIRLIGNGQAPVHKYWEELLEMIRRQEINPLDMVTHRVRLEDMDTVYALFDERAPGMQKVFVQTKFSSPPAHGAPQLSRF
ncbi:hypothetical protein ASPZODRAFT_148994 [Penicilliopsis zonata CBS 506.65]|uniref:Alcohol dehydrogenase-like N-terminal domain-containing protein n=1 Tax=Penicilliopsis zonata CBS 506.65 TaxID=1073090 RepID=A0A1L9SXC7_9EURO|nr:hypothetical protein ASPZODRAFT_148994 [Penicilliopsis zonata CBS 506.65]OJJ51787.1 hypothetical protein ASPZODRAFT_148994 [Penicilliopsis zonata CBS 506.65]